MQSGSMQQDRQMSKSGLDKKFITTAQASLFKLAINHIDVKLSKKAEGLLSNIKSDADSYEFVKWFGSHLLT